MPNDKIEEITHALEAATPGPWTWGRWQHDRDRILVESKYNSALVADAECLDESDANLIANAPEWLRYLLQLVEQQQAEIIELKVAYGEVLTGSRNHLAECRKANQQLRQSREENERMLLEIKITKAELNAVEKLGLKYQGELERYRTPRPIDEWHEDIGDVLWWKLPIKEPPYCGSPLDSEWLDYHTHWTPLMVPLEEGSDG